MMVRAKDIHPPLDAGIPDAVEILQAANVETYESCEGGIGHAYPDRVVGKRVSDTCTNSGLTRTR